MTQTPKNATENDRSGYKKEVAQQRRLKKLRRMKLRDRQGDVAVSDISDVEVVDEGQEPPQDAWLNDLLKDDGDHSKRTPPSPAESAPAPADSDASQDSIASKICAFTSENSFLLKALLGVGIATIAITLIARLR